MHGQAPHPRILIRPTPVFIAVFLAGVLVHRLARWHVWTESRPLGIWLGIACITLGAAWFIWGVQTLRKARTGVMLHKSASRLVQEGPYRWSRNPQYLAYSTICIGAALVVNSWWPILMLPVALAIVLVGVVAPEERYMANRFGAEYAEYQRRVGRWI